MFLAVLSPEALQLGAFLDRIHEPVGFAPALAEQIIEAEASFFSHRAQLLFGRGRVSNAPFGYGSFHSLF
jgi:hypothetical protein